MDQIKEIFSGEWWEWGFSGVGPWIIGTAGSVAATCFVRKKYSDKRPLIGETKVEGNGNKVIQGKNNYGNILADQIETVIKRYLFNFTGNNGFTEEQYKKLLEEQRKTIREEMRAAAGNEEKLKLLEEKYSVVQNKLTDLQKSYEEREKLLKQASEDLERIKGNLPDSQLAEAEEKLEKGETKAAEQAFDAVIDQGAGAISLAAFRSGTLSEDRLDYEKAFRQYKKAAVLEEDNPEYLLAAGKMARTLADYRQAQDWLEQLLKIREAEKKEDTNLASAMYNLAWVYKSQGCYDKAEPLYKRTRAILEKTLGKDHHEVVTTLNNLADLYIKQGRYDDAEPLYRRTLAILKKTLGKNHNDVATTLKNLADLYIKQGRYYEADPFFKRTLAILEKTLGKNHPSVVSTLNNLPNLYSYQDRYDDDESFFKHALEIKEKTLGKKHNDVERILKNLTDLYIKQGRYYEAEPLYKRSLDIKEKTLGKDHPSVATTLNNLGWLYYLQGRYKEVEPLNKRCSEILHAAFPDGHPCIDTFNSNVKKLKYGMRKNIYIGPTAGRIGEITKDHVNFTDEAGESRRIRRLPPFSSCSSDIVGISELDKAPWTVNLSGYEKGVTFIFESFGAAYELLLFPLLELGLDTMDAT